MTLRTPVKILTGKINENVNKYRNLIDRIVQFFQMLNKNLKQ